MARSDDIFNEFGGVPIALASGDRNVQKSADDLKAWQLDQVETVEQLKDWIREYLP